jgi:mannose-6-phosphate isomerase-like protein (cupin superfamily)
MNDETSQFKAGDLLLVPQGAVHRFENFSKDFATWVIFYGPTKVETEE